VGRDSGLGKGSGRDQDRVGKNGAKNEQMRDLN
jgi:hypothetical protein